MTSYVALLRAVNVGGTGKLAMTDLRSLCEAQGFRNPRTYIASGNVVFDADMDETEVRARLEAALQAYASKAIGAMVRSGEQMAAVLAANPFGAAPPNKVMAIFLGEAPPRDVMSGAAGHAEEQIATGLREIYVHYPNGQGSSKLRLPAAAGGTARNMNTVQVLASMADG